jgi:hypothetical protein
MAEPVRAKKQDRIPFEKGNHDESSELYESVLSSRPGSGSYS